jgi:hypothetical protein
MHLTNVDARMYILWGLLFFKNPVDQRKSPLYSPTVEETTLKIGAIGLCLLKKPSLARYIGHKYGINGVCLITIHSNQKEINRKMHRSRTAVPFFRSSFGEAEQRRGL